MDLSTSANVATAAAVITGMIFGVLELRHARREREERAAFEVVHAMLTPEWMRSVVRVQAIPDAFGARSGSAKARTSCTRVGGPERRGCARENRESEVK